MRMDMWLLVKKIYKIVLPPWATYLRKELKNCKTALDLGCGDYSPIQNVTLSYSVGVDAFKPSLKESKRRGIHYEYVLADVREIEFKDKSFDAVLALDLIEHLTKEDGIKLIEKMERWARKKVIIFTPNGFLCQRGNSNPFQTHRSGWNCNELKGLGFRVYGMNGWKKLRGYGAGLRYRPKIVWQIISDLTQKITHHHPEWAFQLLAVKDMESGDQNKDCCKI